MTNLKLEPNTLWSKIIACTQSALASGALQSLPTEQTIIEDEGIPFITRVLQNLQRKKEARKKQKTNPFLPYEDALFVSEISDSHVCLLNKFNVVENHLLMITREFEAQEDWLNEQDFEAMWACLAGVDGLAFYNGGEKAGASQPHKHLQLVPFESNLAFGSLPIEGAIASISWHNEIETIRGFEFPHAIAKLDPNLHKNSHQAAQITLELYQKLLQHLEIEITGKQHTQPYNFLATREWLLIVPRSQAEFSGIPVNSLGFAGALLVRNQEQLAYLKAFGPLNLLKEVT
ncbi:MAG: ATP adenylyltransferase family protein [Spirulinaceae cyanobacterium]